MPILTPPAQINDSSHFKEKITLIKYGMPKSNNLVMSVYILSSSYQSATNENRLLFTGDLNSRISITDLVLQIKNSQFRSSKLYIAHDVNDLNPRIVIGAISEIWNRTAPNWVLMPEILTAQLHVNTLLDIMNSETIYFSQGQFSNGFSIVNGCINNGGSSCDDIVCRMMSTLYGIARSYYSRLS